MVKLHEKLIKEMILLYEKVEGVYGYRQLTINLRRQTSQLINHKRIYRLMKLTGIQSVIRRKKKKYDKSIVSYVLGHSNNNSLVFQTFDLALQVAPGSTPMIHSDRGFQYTSWGFKKRLKSYGLTQSMSRVGKCIDNGPMEGFWGTLKCEKYYLHKYQTFEALKKDIDNYIYFYNYERLQAKLNSLSPMEVRTKAA